MVCQRTKLLRQLFKGLFFYQNKADLFKDLQFDTHRRRDVLLVVFSRLNQIEIVQGLDRIYIYHI
jgi:hypothetical protein